MVERYHSKEYTDLDQLSTEALEELIRADFEMPGDNNNETIFYILDILEKREHENPTGDTFDVKQAWADFKQYYDIPEGRGLSLYPVDEVEIKQSKASPTHKQFLYVWKRVGTIAAAIGIFFALLIGAQAIGVDVFGTLGRWTDETFHFVSPLSEATGTVEDLNAANTDYYNSIQATLDDFAIIEELVPTRYPDGFKMSEPKVVNTSLSDIINIAFSGEPDRFFSITITKYQSASDLNTFTFEKDDSTVEQYLSGTKTFYIMTNIDTITATWSNGILVEQISGNLSIDEIKIMINSIGGDVS